MTPPIAKSIPKIAPNPLFARIVGRSPEVAYLLLERGIDTRVRYNTETMKNMDAVAFAMMWGRVAALLQSGADPNLEADHDAAPVRVAASFHDPAILKLLLQNPAILGTINP